MRCRPANDDDVGAFAALRRAWTEEVHGPADDAAFDEAFAAWWASERGRRRMWVAEVDGAPIGMVSIVVMTRMPRPGRPTSPWGYVHNMYVLPEHRSGGVGGELMRVAIDACRADGYERLVLHPRDEAVRFYERLGFGPADDLLRLRL